jgi:uncharacterized membrane protein YoaK (UPF0700 family)
MTLWQQVKQLLLFHTKAAQTPEEEHGVTLVDLPSAPGERGRIGLLLVLLTLTAAWIDMLSYLFLGRVFASFMTGNLLFIGLGVATGNSGLLMRALIAVVIFLIGVTFGSFCLDRAPRQQSEIAWHYTFVRYLLMEWLILLAYGVISLVTSNLSQNGGVKILLLCLGALGMGIQAALVLAFKIPGAVIVALTGTLIALGQDLAELGVKGHAWRWSGFFLVLLCLVYVVSAFLVALTETFVLTPIVPLVVVTIAIFAVLFPSHKVIVGLPAPSS